MFWTAPWPKKEQLPRGAIPHLLGDGDGMHYGHEALYNAKGVMDEPGQGNLTVSAQGVAGSLEGMVMLLTVYFRYKHGVITWPQPSSEPQPSPQW